MHIGCDLKDTDGLPKKSGFLALGLGKGYCDLWTAQGDRDPWESRSGAKVKQSGDSRGKRVRASDGLHKVAGEDLVFVLNGGQIDAGIPAKKKRTISIEAADKQRVNWLKLSFG